MTRRPPTTEIRTVLRTILSAGVLAVLLLACSGTAAGATWVVDDGDADFASIQAAVDAAAAGDTIEVRSGTYVENVVVDKSLNLRGENSDTVIIDANGKTGVRWMQHTDNVSISEFTIRNASMGIDVYSHTRGSVIRNNIITNSWIGIDCWQIDNTITVVGNTITNNERGIILSATPALIYLNNFIKNSVNVETSPSSTNIWNSTGKIVYIYNDNTYTNYLGNYWDDYTGTDSDGDGIGDTSTRSRAAAARIDIR